jgi:hypothetical protein
MGAGYRGVARNAPTATARISAHTKTARRNACRFFFRKNLQITYRYNTDIFINFAAEIYR